MEDSFFLVTAFDSHYDAGFLCAASHKAYAEKHGQRQKAFVLSAQELGELCEQRAFQWAKVALLRRLLREEPRASWLVWLDADALLLDFETELRQIVAKAEKGCDVIVSEDMSCASEINTGVIFVRTSSQWALRLFDEVWQGADPKLYHAPFHEQTALCRRLRQRLKGPWQWSWQGGPRCQVLEKVMVLDCGLLNFKHPEQRPFAVHLVDDHLRRGGLSKAARARQLLTQRWGRSCSPVSGDPSPKMREACAFWNASLASMNLEPPKLSELPMSAAAVEVADAAFSAAERAPWVLAQLECSEDLVTVTPWGPWRPADGPVQRPARLWELCRYLRGAPPAHHAYLGQRPWTGPGVGWQATWRFGPELENSELWLAPAGARRRLERLETQLLVAPMDGVVDVAVLGSEEDCQVESEGGDPFADRRFRVARLAPGQQTAVQRLQWLALRAASPCSVLLRRIPSDADTAGREAAGARLPPKPWPAAACRRAGESCGAWAVRLGGVPAPCFPDAWYVARYTIWREDGRCLCSEGPALLCASGRADLQRPVGPRLAGAACALLGLAPRRAAKAALLAPLTAALAPEANCGDLLVEVEVLGLAGNPCACGDSFPEFACGACGLKG
ncbi:unnamed protein product [Effrenium voratum]|uniref:Nucleotide-diphospho-sugar transferase domain-containing protein n=1 Tax=Effrenium voratum TaxID=2562239 RepID=A0AA36IWS1_9DINO|nr:unnamed protein product [Effrenium voratum]